MMLIPLTAIVYRRTKFKIPSWKESVHPAGPWGRASSAGSIITLTSTACRGKTARGDGDSQEQAAAPPDTATDAYTHTHTLLWNSCGSISTGKQFKIWIYDMIAHLGRCTHINKKNKYVNIRSMNINRFWDRLQHCCRPEFSGNQIWTLCKAPGSTYKSWKAACCFRFPP